MAKKRKRKKGNGLGSESKGGKKKRINATTARKEGGRRRRRGKTTKATREGDKGDEERKDGRKHGGDGRWDLRNALFGLKTVGGCSIRLGITDEGGFLQDRSVMATSDEVNHGASRI